MESTIDAFHRVKDTVKTILGTIEGIKKPQRKFMLHIFELYLGMRGRYNFMNLSRYGHYYEQSYRNNFSREFDFCGFNIELIKQHCPLHLVIAFDPSYIPKSGKHTAHLGYFWSGVSGKALKGLEIGGIAAIDVDNNTAMNLEAIQTPSTKTLKAENKTLIDHYAETLVSRQSTLKELSNTLVVDGYFAKKGFIDTITQQTGMQIVSKLRKDADLKYLYNGPRENRKGAPRKFDGKVNIQAPDKRRLQLQYEDEQTKIYSGTLWSTRLKRKIKLAYVEWWQEGSYTGQYAALFSTDLELEGITIYQYYKSRFQIEFLYRDAKQYVGLNHCQARDSQKLHFHFNTSLTTVSLAKAVHYLQEQQCPGTTFSMEDIKTLYANRMLTQRIFSNLDLDLSCKKIKAVYYDAIFFGRKVA